MPLNPKDYVHRVGRTARAGRAGLAYTFVTQYDVESYMKIESSIDKKLEENKLEEKEVLKFHSRVLEASRIAEYELKNIIKTSKGKY